MNHSGTYPNHYISYWELKGKGNCTYFFNFDRFDTESGYDFLYVS